MDQTRDGKPSNVFFIVLSEQIEAGRNESIFERRRHRRRRCRRCDAVRRHQEGQGRISDRLQQP